MHYRLFYILTLSLNILLAVTSCTSCGNGGRKGGEENPMVQLLDETPDEARLAVLDEVLDDVLRMTDPASGSKVTYKYLDAQAGGNIHGTLRVGDTFSILPQKQTGSISIAINVTELSGRWVYDQSQQRGIDFNAQGGMSSINSETICFREWKLLNGQLYLYYIDMQTVADDRHKYEVEEASIMYLDANRLNLLFRGDTYECVRPSTTPVMIR